MPDLLDRPDARRIQGAPGVAGDMRAVSQPRKPHNARPVPDFVVIGAMKAGTTSLYAYLSGHPDITMSRMKETDFFIAEKNWSLGQDWYRRQFRGSGRLTGEVSPNYAKDDIFPGVPARIAAQSPHAKLIFVARDPVDRFVSQYRHEWLLGHLSEGPDTLLQSRAGAQILRHSCYAAQLAAYRACFPREQLLILDFKELTEAPPTALRRVAEFLSLPPMPTETLPPQNAAGDIARMPGWAQKAWRSKAFRRLDPLISRRMRAVGRKVLARGKPRAAPDLPPPVLDVVGRRLQPDADAFRRMSGLSFSHWSI